ncbi:MAG: LysR family transcriptional regulator [Lysobacterales bacterium]
MTFLNFLNLEPVMTPSLRGLRVFCAAAKQLSFKAAAESLFITASAVSHQIKALEREFEAELFVRGPRSLSLTPRGTALFEQLDPLLKEIGHVCSSVFEDTTSPPIRLAAPPFFATERLIARLPDALAEGGHFALELSTITGRADCHPDNADIAVLLAETPPEGTGSLPLFSLDLVPACAPALALSLEGKEPGQWRSQTLIVHRGRANAWRRWFAQKDMKLTHPDRVMLLDSMFAVARAAEQGLGIALVPKALSTKWFQSGGLIQLSSDPLTTGDSYFLSWLNNEESKAGLRDLSRQLAEMLIDT